MDDIQKHAITGGSCLILGLFLGMSVNGNINPTDTPLEDQHGIAADPDLDDLQRQYDESLAEVMMDRAEGATTDPEIINGMRRTVEILELGCKNYGSACDEAKLVRKQLDDMIAGR